jgi:hypothetical protein
MRKAFERRREEGVGFNEATSGLVELGERKRRAEFEGASPLAVCDGDGCLEGFFRWLGVRGITL